MATEKQINYAKTLGIEDPEQYETKALSAKIDEAMRAKGMTPKPFVKPTQNNQQSITATTNVVISRTEKPNSLEIGKAGNRIKFYFDSVQEAVLLKQAFIDADLIEQEVKDFSEGVVM